MPQPATPAPNANVDLSGRELGDYHLLRRLGKGAMAEVYLAEQKSLGRQVAFKVLKPELASDQTYVRRFEMEARAAAALVHGNIVQIYEVGHVDGVQFIAQEYVPGQNLAQVLARSGNLEVPVAVGIMRQVAVALAKAAEQGIVHRDIKPENLMLSSSGEVKVADFGLARITQGTDQLQLTQVGVTMGSPLYMSPEQVEGKRLDPRSDIYSFGVTCYQMLAGRPPFSGDTALSVAVQHLKNLPEPLENIRVDLPPGLCRIVHKMLSKSAQDRYADGAEVLRDLRALDIPGANGDWPEEFEQFNTSEMVALSTARSAATQQLSALMAQDNALRAGADSRRWLLSKLIWIPVAAGLLLGVFLGWPRSGASLLSGAADKPVQLSGQLERQENGRRQYEYAMLLGSEEGWLGVLEYYPDDRHHGQLARKQLAELYLTQDRLFEALQVFDDFTRAGDAEPELLAYGLAGKYVVYTLEGLPDRAKGILIELWPLRERLARYDRQMTVRVAELVRRTQQLDDQEKHRELDALLERHLDSQDRE
ncbi:MAG: serine/threonine protein kinase [Planctomycetota bacterium]|nr:serine/threonine protein kinase [Planctomycetota bacterium]